VLVGAFCCLQIWPQVKAENAHLSSVCELGAIVGSLWRDLDPTQKQEYNELYAKDKVTITVRSTILHRSNKLKLENSCIEL